MSAFHIRGIRLENICNASKDKASNKAVIEGTLPAFLLVLLTRLHVEQVASWRVEVVTTTTAEVAPSRESVDVQRSADKVARAKAL